MSSDIDKNPVTTIGSQCTMFKYQAHNGCDLTTRSKSGYLLVFYAGVMHTKLRLRFNVTLHVSFSC